MYGLGLRSKIRGTPVLDPDKTHDKIGVPDCVTDCVTCIYLVPDYNLVT